MNLRIRGVCVELGGSPVVDGVDFDVEAGQMAGVVGPNGSGKTTLLRSAYRSLRPHAGTVLISDGEHGADGTDIWSLSTKQVARRITVLGQERSDDFEMSVTEVVLTGRTPHKGLLERDTAADHELVARLLGQVGLGWAAGRYFSSLSGGEKQRVLVAKALAQQTDLVLLDEPTNHLDIAAQRSLLDLLRQIVEEQQLTIVAVLHDLNLAAAYTDHIMVMHRGKVAAAGAPEEVLTEQVLQEVFEVPAYCGVHPVTGRLHVAVHMGRRSAPGTPDRAAADTRPAPDPDLTLTANTRTE